ncbi:hypothetical protein [Apilactobacillus xinyiensis]|uniref:hypothetical protein n=1 Tax=Apilactobacillus xinyiensis TaxID=2841032 RepID=UPI00336526C7
MDLSIISIVISGVSVVCTLTLCIFNYISLKNSIKATKISNKMFQLSNNNQRKSQASKVTTWVNKVNPGHDSEIITRESMCLPLNMGEQAIEAIKSNDYYDSEYIVDNNSNECIYNVFSFTKSNNSTCMTQSQKENAAHGNPIRFDNHKYVEILKPHGNYSVRFLMQHAIAGEHDVPEIFFTDSSGVKWHRLSNGKLEEMDYIPYLSAYVMKHIH